MKLGSLILLIAIPLTGCLDAADSPPVATATASIKNPILIPPLNGGPYNVCGTELCVEGYVDTAIVPDLFQIEAMINDALVLAA